MERDEFRKGVGMVRMVLTVGIAGRAYRKGGGAALLVPPLRTTGNAGDGVVGGAGGHCSLRARKGRSHGGSNSNLSGPIGYAQLDPQFLWAEGAGQWADPPPLAGLSPCRGGGSIGLLALGLSQLRKPHG